VLVRAARRLAEGGTRLRWVLAGTGLSEADVLADWPAELRGDVTVRSRIGRPEEDGLYREADLFVLPSRFEGQPLTLVQAMRYGLCCVTTRCCGQIDLIEDGRTGILITPGSEAELADAIAGAIADRSARERIGAAARESVSDRSWEAVSREVVAAAVETFGLSVEPSPGLGPEGRRHPGSTFPLSGVEGIKHIEPAPGWPDLWRHTHEYDLREIYGDPSWPGYSCAYRMRRAETLDLIRRAAPAGGSILDVAAAQGNFSLSLAAMGYSVTWNDLRGELEGYVRQKWERGAIRYAPGNLFELDLPDRFDLVLAGEVIEHVAHPDHFLAALAGFVKEGGHLLVSTPNGGYFLNHLPRFSECRDSARYEAVQFRPDSDGHIFLLYKDEIRSMAASCGLRVEEIRLFGNPLACGHLRTGALHRWLPAGAIDGIERLARKMPLGFRRRLLSGMAVLLKKDAPEEDASRCGEVGRPC
jgi:2-polyprenyl-6-hydroxyphenyl methylase/3-demethylubiquinone-9 3-methyltransferase